MKAILVEDGNLVWGDAPDPSPGPGEILIRNHASAINRADLAQRAGGYPPPPGASEILGLECAGEVVAIGDGVLRYKEGDRVCALLAGGGYAEQVVVHAGQALPVPQGIELRDAAALPEVFATAWLNLYMEARLEVGERVLLHAGASGVGTAAIQLCREFDNPCFVTAGSNDKIEHCRALGAAGGVDRHEGSFVDSVAEWTDGQGVDVILDPVGAGYLKDNIRSLNRDGRLVIIGLMGGGNAEIELGLMMVKRLRIIGSTLRARSVAAKSRVMDELQDRVWPLIEAGAIEPIIETRLPIAEADAAHKLIASNETVGKVILTID